MWNNCIIPLVSVVQKPADPQAWHLKNSLTLCTSDHISNENQTSYLHIQAPGALTSGSWPDTLAFWNATTVNRLLLL